MNVDDIEEVRRAIEQARDFAAEYHEPELIHALAEQVIELGEELLRLRAKAP